jgi:glucose/arabinose dehydrogenase
MVSASVRRATLRAGMLAIVSVWASFAAADAPPATEGWRPLFGGTATLGGTGDLVADEPFTFFELTFDYRLAPPVDDAATKRAEAVAKGAATRPLGNWNEVLFRVTPTTGEVYVNGKRHSSFNRAKDDWRTHMEKSPFVRFTAFASGSAGPIVLHDEGAAAELRDIAVRPLCEGRQAWHAADTTAATFEPVLTGLEWTGFEPVDDDGKPRSFRPIVLAHAGDGSGRTFVATQEGVIHAFRPGDAATTVFADLSASVTYKDRQNELGFLGLAFHPRFRETGEFFVCYTAGAESPHVTVIARRRVLADDPSRADPDFEERLVELPKKHWNHNGGTVCFGPDGMLYFTLGDGGGAYDPYLSGQDPGDLMGSILRVDVDRKDPGQPYAIPPDNPFVGRADFRPEVYAYGLRNVWRMAFDRPTGRLWAADVGQLLYEEIDIIEKGGNYGWSFMEGFHQFGHRQPPEGSHFLPPVFEYDRNVGASIIGGFVYRGRSVPALEGRYLYADHISGECFALEYDAERGRVVTNERIPSRKLPVLSFGEDADGEAYALVASRDGRSIYRLTPGGGPANGTAASR